MSKFALCVNVLILSIQLPILAWRYENPLIDQVGYKEQHKMRLRDIDFIFEHFGISSMKKWLSILNLCL